MNEVDAIPVDVGRVGRRTACLRFVMGAEIDVAALWISPIGQGFPANAEGFEEDIHCH
jgi:hypothetical protein